MYFSNREALLGVTGYPVPQRTIEAVARRRGLDLDEGASSASMVTPSFRLCEADLLMWLLRAPNVSQGGQSYNFTDEQRRDFLRRARAIYGELDPGALDTIGGNYGYKGTRL